MLRNMTNKFISLIVVICLCVGLLSGCGKESPDANRKVRINMTYSYTSATSLVMKEKKILQKYLPENVEIEYSYLLTGPDMRDAMLSNNVDIADLSLMNFISARENNLPLIMVSNAGNHFVAVYSHNRDIHSMSDFKQGDRISITNKSTNLHAAFLAICKAELGNAVALDENLTAIPAADAISSLETSNDFEGAVFSFPNTVKADQMEGLTKIADTSELEKGYEISSVYTIRKEYYENNPDIIKAFLNAQNETLEWISENQDEAAEILTKYFECEKKEILDVLLTIPPTKEVTAYDKQAALMYEAGILTKEPEPFSSLENYDDIIK